VNDEAHAEVERLTKERDLARGAMEINKRAADRVEAARDEAVKAAEGLREALRDVVMHYERAMDRYPIMDEPAAYALDRARAALAALPPEETPATTNKEDRHG
jgi:triphosphoribosyl-dephospho-CoA synthetase